MAYTLQMSDTHLPSYNCRSTCFDGTYFWSGDENGSVYTYTWDGTTLTYKHTLAVSAGNHIRNMISDGTYIYAGCDDNKIYALSYNGTTISNLDNITLDHDPYGMSYDGTYIYVMTYQSLYGLSFNGTSFTNHDQETSPSNGKDVVSDSNYVYDSQNNYLHARTFNGSSFTDVDDISMGGAGSLILDGTYVVAAYGSSIKAYQLSGSTWAQVGNTYSGTGTYGKGVYDGTNYIIPNSSGELYTYSFDGTDFSEEGKIDILSGTIWHPARNGNLYLVASVNASYRVMAIKMALTAQIGYDSITGQAPHTVNFTGS